MVGNSWESGSRLRSWTHMSQTRRNLIQRIVCDGIRHFVGFLTLESSREIENLFPWWSSQFFSRIYWFLGTLFRELVLSAQKELRAVLWICFRPSRGKTIFDEKIRHPLSGGGWGGSNPGRGRFSDEITHIRHLDWIFIDFNVLGPSKRPYGFLSAINRFRSLKIALEMCLGWFRSDKLE